MSYAEVAAKGPKQSDEEVSSMMPTLHEVYSANVTTEVRDPGIAVISS